MRARTLCHQLVAIGCLCPSALAWHGYCGQVLPLAPPGGRGAMRRCAITGTAEESGSAWRPGRRRGPVAPRAIAPRADTATSRAEPEVKSDEYSWETAVVRFGLMPRSLLRAASGIESAVGGALGSLPGFLMVKRTSQIWTFLTTVIIKTAIGGGLSGADEEKLARECKDGLLALGPTFIKLGQLLSTRVDVMPQAFIKELSTLQDDCPPFPVEEVKRIVAAELGEGKFKDFDEKPLAAASLGQVHLATTAEGDRVVVKVQRPGLKELFRVDLKNLQVLSEVAMQLDRTPDRILRDWREIFVQNARIIYEEIDYCLEAANAEKFAENFKDVPWLRVPRIYSNYSSERVLTMEYVPGVKINRIPDIDKLGLDRKRLAAYCAESYLIQLLRYGFFHCDPHPGNVACEAMEEAAPGALAEPRIILYDYGMMGTLNPRLKAGLVKGFFAVYEKDYRSLADALYDAELIGEDTDRLSVEIICRYFVRTFSERFALNRKSMPADKGERDRMRIAAMQSIGQELAAIGGEKPFRYPDAFPFILRAFTALEGIGKSLDKEYDVYRIARRYLKELIDLKDGSAAITAFKTVQKRLGLRSEDLAGLVTFPQKITTLQKFVDRLETGEVKLRVRALEVERAMFRSILLQKACVYAVFACMLINVGCAVLMAVGRHTFGALQAIGGGAIYCLVRAILYLLKLRSVLRDESKRYYNSYIG